MTTVPSPMIYIRNKYNLGVLQALTGSTEKGDVK